MPDHQVGTREQWLAAREALLAREKELTRLGDELARQRRDLPWVPVEKQYRLQTDQGTKTLAELFDGRSQLLVYHFMFGPAYESGCPVCSSGADTVNAALPHIQARDVTVLYVSRAPLEKLQAYKKRMGWTFQWASSAESDFNFDFGASHSEEEVRGRLGPMLERGAPPAVSQLVDATGSDLIGYLSETPAFTAFALDGGTVYHTYSTSARGLEFLLGYYPILDRAPKGRAETDSSQLLLRRHDEYDS